jgi:hypothetical protein
VSDNAIEKWSDCVIETKGVWPEFMVAMAQVFHEQF